MTATGISVAAVEPRGLRRLSDRPALAGEVAILGVLLFVYDRLRTLAPIERDRAVRHGFDLLRLEGVMSWEKTFNHWLAGHGGLDAFAVDYYQFAHIGAALTILAWCYVRRPDIYRPARTALVAINVVGLLLFAWYPVAPPRLLPGAGFADLVARAGYGSSHGPIPIDAYAAMPSLHLAWAVCVAMTGLAIARTTLTRAAFVLHPVLTGAIVIGTGNHYVADVVAGTLLGAAACVGAGWRSSPTQGRSSGVPAFGEPLDRFTLVSFHAHPDDESLLTGGTLARAAVEGHRVVAVVATLGGAGLTDLRADPAELATHRLGELTRAAAELGCARVEWLGYGDSGRFGEAAASDAFATADPEEAARRLARILRDERADVLTIYDAAGGYGHPDHVRVHLVGSRAAELAGTPVVLEATADRRSLLRVTRILRLVPRLPAEFRPKRVRVSYCAHEQLTHRVDVRAYADRKRAAMLAHASQRSGGDGPRSLALYLRLPRRLFRWCFGTEWFVEQGRAPAGQLLDDPFASLRADPAAHARLALTRPASGDGVPTRDDREPVR